MANIDDFATVLLEEAKRFFEKAEKEQDESAQSANLHSALLLAFCSLEAHVNAVAEELSIRAELSLHEKGLLLERDVRLEAGEFTLKGLKMYRLEERYEFIYRRFSGKPLSKDEEWRTRLLGAINLRNKLTHPKNPLQITLNSVRSAIESVIAAIDALYKGVYRRKFPAASRGLASRLEF